VACGEQTAQRPDEEGGAMMMSVEPRWRQASPNESPIRIGPSALA